MTNQWLVGARISDGRALGVDRFQSKDKVYVLPKDQIGSWELLRLTRHDDGRFDLYFMDAGVQLSVNDDGGFETRPAGSFGPWEMFDAAESPDGAIAVAWRMAKGKPLGRIWLEAAA